MAPCTVLFATLSIQPIGKRAQDATGLLKSAQIGKYRIEGLLGVGGMGAVYKATNPDIKGSRVAIKVMNPAIAGAEQVRERFKREAAAVAALRTSHVVKVYDFNAEPDGMLYLVMELLDGHALRNEITPGPSYMDLARVHMVMDGALKGLAAAHKVGIVHRDLKPENIHIAETDDGEVPKLLDFGIARVRTEGQNLTGTGSLMGTASYMANEQIAAGAEIGSWTDVYAMGAILYEMLAGAPAFGGNTITEVLQRVLKAECVPLSTVRAGLPDSIYKLVERCMSSNTTERPVDAEAMRGALTAARLVPFGVPVPPPHQTKPDLPTVSRSTPAPATPASIGIMATEGHVTPVPSSTPPGGARAAIHVTPPTASVTGSAPGSAPIAAGTDAGVDRAIDVAKPKSKLPLVIGGVAVIGIGAIAIVKLSGSKAADVPKDASPVAIVDAAAKVVDATIEVAIDAAVELPLPDFTKSMVRFAVGTYDVGDDPKPAPGARAKGTASVGALWIDKDEVTLETVRTALKSPKVGGMPGDTPAMPARNVSWEQAGATCKALGKRLPTEDEWEIAARTTPRDASKAALCRIAQCTGAKLVVTKHEDCSKDGLCDMLGGVIEWTSNESGKDKIVRGGAYTVSAKAGWEASIQFRSAVPPAADTEVGFRCVWTRDMALGGL